MLEVVEIDEQQGATAAIAAGAPPPAPPISQHTPSRHHSRDNGAYRATTAIPIAASSNALGMNASAPGVHPAVRPLPPRRCSIVEMPTTAPATSRSGETATETSIAAPSREDRTVS